jgi:hypothetical protein
MLYLEIMRRHKYYYPLIFHEVIELRKILLSMIWALFFLSAYRYSFDIWLQIKFGFGPLIFHEVMTLRLRKILRIVSFLQFCSPLPALQSRIGTNQNLVLLCLNYF